MPIVKMLIAALAFGLSAPLAKLLLDVVSPLFLAGLLYLGAGVFLGLVRLAWRRRPAVGRPLTVRVSAGSQSPMSNACETTRVPGFNSAMSFGRSLRFSAGRR